MSERKERERTDPTDHEIASAFVYGNGNAHRDDVAVSALEGVIANIRRDERYKIGLELGRVANQIYNEQEKDFPSNVLDRVAASLRCSEPLIAAVIAKNPR